jgi:hypothetical protein
MIGEIVDLRIAGAGHFSLAGVGAGHISPPGVGAGHISPPGVGAGAPDALAGEVAA